jgi:hypothetical protein
MPEATVDEDGDPRRSKDDIRPPTKLPQWRDINSVPQTGGVQATPDR